jgi:sodium/proline symporter
MINILMMNIPIAKETMVLELFTFVAYFAFLLLVAFLTTKRQKTDTDFILGNRSLNFWLTALSAHASDMSSWLFLAYPALIFTTGLFSAWAAIGLVVFMFLNWHLIAPRIRIVTELSNSLTLNSYFESRFADTSGTIRLVSATMSVFFFTIYISSGLIGLGILVESLFNLNYLIGISIGLAIVVIYVFAGGYRTVAYIDLFQGFFLLGVIVFIPILILIQINGIEPVMDAARAKHLTTTLIPHSAYTFWQMCSAAFGWGLGYFGQPHIITKFMGIRQVSDMRKAKYVGISWMSIALFAATIVGLVGIYIFPHGLADPQQVILEIVKSTLPPIFAGLVLCAILAATTNVMAAQILVVASNLSEDYYKKLFRQHASPKELLLISRISVIIVALIAFFIAYFKISTIYSLVLYAWSGLGASFGPLIILSLFLKTSINRYGAFAGILAGGLTAIIWDYFSKQHHWDIPSMIPGFVCSTIAILGVSFATRKQTALTEI